MSQQKASKHKQTVYCTVKGCNYTSRQWVIDISEHKEWGKNQRESVYSTKCPKHQTQLTTVKQSAQ